ncbi:MAG: M48 family metalloprotease [Thermoplasmata archaeon]|nr:M48 family metalloprotease [Thermoplasmata archaeon]
MFPALVAILYLPVGAWIAAGVGLMYAFRRSAPPVVLRLAATFLALWALLATTTLVWVLANGGWTAIATLLRSPLLLFDPSYVRWWLYGAVGALLVFCIAFLVNQLVGRGFLHLLRPRLLAWPPELPRPRERSSLLVYRSERPEAFSFTLLEPGTPWWSRPRRHEVVLLSAALGNLLTSQERQAAIAHELGHVRGLDSRYLTFVRTFSRMMRWDPLLAYLARSLTRREEIRADLEAVRMTGQPLALARAIYKVVTFEPPLPRAGVAGFLGATGRRGRPAALDRIQRLVALAESGKFPEPASA